MGDIFSGSVFFNNSESRNNVCAFSDSADSNLIQVHPLYYSTQTSTKCNGYWTLHGEWYNIWMWNTWNIIWKATRNPCNIYLDDLFSSFLICEEVIHWIQWYHCTIRCTVFRVNIIIKYKDETALECIVKNESHIGL